MQFIVLHKHNYGDSVYCVIWAKSKETERDNQILIWFNSMVGKYISTMLLFVEVTRYLENMWEWRITS